MAKKKVKDTTCEVPEGADINCVVNNNTHIQLTMDDNTCDESWISANTVCKVKYICTGTGSAIPDGDAICDGTCTCDFSDTCDCSYTLSETDNTCTATYTYDYNYYDGDGNYQGSGFARGQCSGTYAEGDTKNNTDFVVLSAFNPNDDETLFMYQQPLTNLTPQPITKNSTSTIQLNQCYNDPGTQESSYMMIYELICAVPSTLFPIKNLSRDLRDNAYDPISIYGNDVAQMLLAYQFYQTIAANPSSDLALGFIDAMQAATAEDATITPQASVDAYFKQTESYKTLDFYAVMAVSTYLNTFAYAWAQGGTYYIYITGSSPATVNAKKKVAKTETDPAIQSTVGDEPSNYAGTIDFKLKSSVTVADPSDHNSNYTITFTPKDGSAIPLYYDQGQFVSELHVDLPTTCFSVSYIQESQLSQDYNDTAIVPMMVGVHNGVQMIGMTKEQTVPGKDWKDKAKQAMVILGDMLTILFLGLTIYQIVGIVARKRVKNSKEKMDKADLDAKNATDREAAREAMEANSPEFNDGVVEQLQGDNFCVVLPLTQLAAGECEEGQTELEISDDPHEMADKYNTDQDAMSTRNRTENNLEALEHEMESVESLVESGINNPEVQDAATTVKEDVSTLTDAIETGDIDQMKTANDIVEPHIPETQANIDEIVQVETSKLSDATEQKLEAQKEAVDAAVAEGEEIKEADEARESGEERGEADEGEDFFFPE